MRVNPSPVIPLFIVLVEDGDTCGTDFGWIYNGGDEGCMIVMIFYFQGGGGLTKAFLFCIFAVGKVIVQLSDRSFKYY
jgi:hypothetical protein